jgi:tetratricopeptide (TPR) repeat protein
MIIDKATRHNQLKFIQAAHYQMAELFILYKNDWNQPRAHLRKMFSVRLDDGESVVDEAKSDLINIFSTIRNVLTSEQIDEDEFHSIMTELLLKLITLYHDYATTPLTPLDYLLIVDRLNYIGFVRQKQQKLSEAWTNHERALEILREHLPPTHPRLATTYYYIGLLHSMMNNHSSALDCLEKALDIQQKALQPNHPHLTETHFQLSVIFERLNKIDDAFQHPKKAIHIGRHAFMTSNDLYMKRYEHQFDKILLLTQSCDELVP